MTNSISDIFPAYISIIQSEEKNSEQYKWEAIQHFQNNWDIGFPDFHEMFKRAFAKRSNLMFQNSYGFLNKLAANFPEESRALFKYLLDDSVPLDIRILSYQQQSTQLLEKLKTRLDNDKLNDQQDERTVSFILTLHNPEKYYLYKENVYKALCKKLNIDSDAKAGQKYFHFVKLSDPLLDEVRNSVDIQNVAKSFIPDAFPFDSTKLIYQDILYRVLIGNEQNELERETLFTISEDVKLALEKRSHPLAKHTWYDNAAREYRQVSIFPNQNIPYMHYEIMLRTNDISWEFHPEGDIDKKELLKPFVEGYDLKKYVRVDWKHSIKSVPYKKGTFFKIVPKAKTKFSLEANEYEAMIASLADQFIELYDDTNNRLIAFLSNASINDTSTANNKIMTAPLNQILYGPPGTGKTYNTINKALEIVGVDCKNLTRKEVKERFDSFVNEGRIVFTTFHQSMSYEDFLEGIKPQVPEKEGDAVIYKIENGIFKQLCVNAAFEYARQNKNSDAAQVLDFSLAFDQLISKVSDQLSKEEEVEFETKNGGKIIVDSISSQGNFLLKHPNRTNLYTISKDRLSRLDAAFPDLDNVSNIDSEFRSIIGGGNSTGNWAVLNEIRKSAPNQISDREERSFSFDEKLQAVKSLKNENYSFNGALSYALIIDEINRGNVSQIFGELITLIEEDKRLGNTESLNIQLQYSKEGFGVPPNLYLIGTMNTADRSVEALDTALRRRFVFEEMPPKYDLDELKYEIAGIKAADLLETINKRIEKLLDKDHLIGHSYFICGDGVEKLEKIKESFYKNIIPLLQEYFYGDFAKIGLVLGAGFVTLKADDQKRENIFAEFQHESSSDFESRDVFEIIDYRKNNSNFKLDFEKAIKLLMKR